MGIWGEKWKSHNVVKIAKKMICRVTVDYSLECNTKQRIEKVAISKGV